MKTYVIAARNGDYVARIRAGSELDACYLLYHSVFPLDAYRRPGHILAVDSANRAKYVLMDQDEGPRFFDHYVITEEGV